VDGSPSRRAANRKLDAQFDRCAHGKRPVFYLCSQKLAIIDSALTCACPKTKVSGNEKFRRFWGRGLVPFQHDVEILGGETFKMIFLLLFSDRPP
jgi:hypothetical protein